MEGAISAPRSCRLIIISSLDCWGKLQDMTNNPDTNKFVILRIIVLLIYFIFMFLINSFVVNSFKSFIFSPFMTIFSNVTFFTIRSLSSP